MQATRTVDLGGGRRATWTWTVDKYPDLSYLDATDGHADQDRLAAYRRGEWHMLTITCVIRQQTASQWADGGLAIGRASLSNVESDSGESYLHQTEEELYDEAVGEVERVQTALATWTPAQR